MIRILAVIIFLISAPALSFAQNIPSPARVWCLYCRPREAMTGSVRSVLAVEKREEHPFDTTVDTYNVLGQKIESMSHNSGREIHSGQIVRLDSRYTYVYDAKGKLVKEAEFSLENPNEVWDAISYVYDNDGQLIEETVLSGKKPFLRTVYTYEPGKRTVTALTTTFVENRVVGPDKAVLVYNDKGQWIRRTIFRSDDSLNGIAEFDYDEKGNLAKETRYGTNGKYSYANVFTHKYDSRGNWYERHEMMFENEAKKEADWLVIYRVISYYEKK